MFLSHVLPQKQGQVRKIDIKGYNGNAYKQTLSPKWSRRRIRDYQDRYEKSINETRASIEDKRITTTATLSPLRTKKTLDVT